MVAWAASILLIVLTTACCIHLLSYMFSAPTLEEVHRSSINPLMPRSFACLLRRVPLFTVYHIPVSDLRISSSGLLGFDGSRWC